MKRAIVTGANGFIGHHFVQELVDDGYMVTAIVKNQNESIDNIKNLLSIEIIYCDLNDISSLPEVVGNMEGSLFFHLAWAGSSGIGREDYLLQLENAKAAAEAAESAAKIKCQRFIGVGSVTQLMYREYLQNDAVAPEMVTCYAIGKIAAEYLSKCICTKYGIEYCWTYISNFYGEDDTTQNFINFIIDSYLDEKTPTLTEGEQLADFMHVSDVARALKCAGEKGTKNSSYYIGYGKPEKLSSFVEKIHKQIAPTIRTGLGEKKFHGLSVDYNKVNYSKLYRDTGFKPKISFDCGIQRVIERRKREKLIK